MGSIDDLNDMKNSEWISWNDLVRRWGKRDFELVKYLQKGFQPYSENGYPFDCPRAHHTYRRLSNEHHRLVAPLGRDQIQYNKNEILPSDSERGYVISPEEEKILEEMKKVEKADNTLSSWQYFEPPELEVDLEEILNDLRKTLFKKEDVQAFEQTSGLDLDKSGNGATAPIIPADAKKKQRHSQRCRGQWREVADRFWKEDKWITLDDMIDRPEMSQFCRKMNKEPYEVRTVKNWIRDLCPHPPKRGRPRIERKSIP